MSDQNTFTDTADPAKRMQAYLLLVLSPLFFSSNLIIGRAAIEDVAPATLAFWRWSIAFVLLLPFALPHLKQVLPVLRARWREVMALGVLGMVVCGALIYVSLAHTTATNGTLIYTSSPVMIILLEWAFRGKRPGLRQMTGVVLALCGVAVIVLRGDAARLLALQFNPGDLGFAAGAFSWAVYSVVIRRSHFTALPTLALFCAVAGTGAALLSPLMVWELIAQDAFPRSQAAWLSIFGVAVISSTLAFSTFQYGIKIHGPSVAGVFMYLLPLYGVSLAIIFLGETLQGFHVAGFAFVATGVMLATFPARRKRVNPL